MLQIFYLLQTYVAFKCFIFQRESWGHSRRGGDEHASRGPVDGACWEPAAGVLVLIPAPGPARAKREREEGSGGGVTAAVFFSAGIRDGGGAGVRTSGASIFETIKYTYLDLSAELVILLALN
jgi:hypothetical protein